MQASPIFARPDFATALDILEDQFRDVDRAGARAYARFMDRDDADLDLLAQRAVGAVGEFLRAVGHDSGNA